MSENEAKISETEVAVFPIKFNGEQEKVAADFTENKSLEIREKARRERVSQFSRLKKTLRKKSASIL